MKIYNTLTRSKEEFVPIAPGKVKMYVCGPTVYGYIHIGNARPLIVFDVVRRYLSSIGYEVNYILNVTDVDDKLIRKAEEMGRPVPEVANLFINAFIEDSRALGVEDATLNPRVTEHIPDIVSFIGQLVDKGYAYAKEGDVFFRSSQFKAYGQLSHQNLDELQYGIRIDVDERKESPQDFVLWKQAKPGEIYWPSPWGDGRPGWHIECSVMAKKYLGDTLDIHGGGTDLQFPHHECELAQSEALSGKPLANYWMHNGFLNMNNEKMSKSLGNVINVKELVKLTKPEAVRFLMLSNHYRNPLNFNDEALKQAENAVERIANCAANLRYRLQDAELAAGGQSGKAEIAAAAEGLDLASLPSVEWADKLEGIHEQFHAKMQDDFNTPDAITAMFELVSAANQLMTRQDASPGDLALCLELFEQMNEVLGLLPQKQEELLDEQIDQLIQERTEARKSKNWARADEIRDLLQEQGILLEDTPQGIRWRRK